MVEEVLVEEVLVEEVLVEEFLVEEVTTGKKKVMNFERPEARRESRSRLSCMKLDFPSICSRTRQPTPKAFLAEEKIHF